MRLLDEQGRLFSRISLVDLAAILLVLLVAGPAAYFGWEIHTAAPYISGVDPMEAVISVSKDIPLVVRGKWFDSQSVPRLGGIPLITLAASTHRLDLLIPTKEINPGSYSLTVTNRRGLSFKWKEPVRLFSEPPRITEVRRVPSKNEGELPPTIKAGSYPVQVINSYGQSVQRDNAITLSPPPPSPLSPVPSRSTFTDPRDLIPVWVVCSFPEPEMRGRRKWLRRGATYYIDDPARPVAKIIGILAKTSIPESDRPLILATLVLACNQDSLAQGVFLYGQGLRGCPPEGESVEIGKRLPFKFQRLDIEGTVLTYPVRLKGTWEEYVDR